MTNGEKLVVGALAGLLTIKIVNNFLKPPEEGRITFHSPPYQWTEHNSESDMLLQKAAGAFYNQGTIPYHTASHDLNGAFGCSCQQ